MHPTLAFLIVLSHRTSSSFHSEKGLNWGIASVQRSGDHLQVDLWSTGVILYELFVGQPPFFTNSIYSLISHIVKGDVKYPSTMSAAMKSFLQVSTRTVD